MEKQCTACGGIGHWWERGENKPWRKLNEGIELDEFGNAVTGGSKLAICDRCKGSGEEPDLRRTV